MGKYISVLVILKTMARRRYRRSRRISLRKTKQKGGSALAFLGPLGQLLGSQFGLGISKRKRKQKGGVLTGWRRRLWHHP